MVSAMILPDYETVLADAGFALAVAPLREWFQREGVSDPELQIALAAAVVLKTQEALLTFTEPKTVH